MILKAVKPKQAIPPRNIAPDYKGPVTLSETGREVFWTGTVAIGLNHVPARHDMHSESTDFIQRVLLRK